MVVRAIAIQTDLAVGDSRQLVCPHPPENSLLPLVKMQSYSRCGTHSDSPANGVLTEQVPVKKSTIEAATSEDNHIPGAGTLQVSRMCVSGNSGGCRLAMVIGRR